MQSIPQAQAKSPDLDEKPHLLLTKTSSRSWLPWFCSSAWWHFQALRVSGFHKRDTGMSSVGCMYHDDCNCSQVSCPRHNWRNKELVYYSTHRPFPSPELSVDSHYAIIMYVGSASLHKNVWSECEESGVVEAHIIIMISNPKSTSAETPPVARILTVLNDKNSESATRGKNWSIRKAEYSAIREFSPLPMLKPNGEDPISTKPLTESCLSKTSGWIWALFSCL